MAKFLSQDQINEYKECFSLYDKQQRGKIKATDLLTVMRCLGASPTPGEVRRHLQTHGIEKKREEYQKPGWLFALVAGHSGRKEEGMACKEHLINSPTGPPLPRLSDGFPLSAGVTPRPHRRATAAALGACPEAGLGVASEGPKPGDGGLSQQEPLLPSSKRAGFVWFLSPSDRKPWAGAGTSDFLQLEPGLG